MTLTTRLTIFFLSALAVVLFGFSVTLYLLERTSWQRRIDDRLRNSLNLLTAAVENEGHGLEWEGRERLRLSESDSVLGTLCWVVVDSKGEVVDHSRSGEDLLWQEGKIRQVTATEQQQWATAHGGVEHKEARDKPFLQPDGKTTRYQTLAFRAALPLQPMQTALRQLAATLTMVSLSLWLMAAFASRWLCRRALTPLRDMAAAARAMPAADRQQRLPVAATGDELHELGQAFNELLSRLQDSFERQARFTGDASHQLRTPLTALLGQIEIALRRPRTAEESQQTLGVLHQQAAQLRQIVDSLLFLARADAEAKAPRLEWLDVRTWLTEQLAWWSSHRRAADLRLETPAAGSYKIRTHAPLLRQLLDNLLDNACKYSNAGTPITLTLSEDRGTTCLWVADAGCGIAEEDLPHVFEPFYRSERTRRQGISGIGLGLAVAQRIAQALGGKLTVQSQASKGTCFTLRIPYDGE